MPATRTPTLPPAFAGQPSPVGLPLNGVAQVQPASLSPAISELERAFRAFCQLPFKRQLPLPVITVLPRGRRNALGWFWARRWQNGQEQVFPEINVCAEHMARPVEDMAELLLHEMCHYANWLDGIFDCTTSQYHNQKFKDRSDSIGLVCEKGRRGWAWTSLSLELLLIVRKVNLDPKAFDLTRGMPTVIGKGVPSSVQRQLRWTCQCPKSQVIRATRGLDVTCNRCLTKYEESPL